ncbi:hypothetical protein CWO91_34810 [Bradyrhizobium genosp. SA-3]|uniref:hypothetical protein n=1 Tax=Bradyrhizobium genosp. SA-3 TaxID=508868 RepID=UPI001028C621|nr:hypothetical protein [Bradyrhizobium genosp. SA-3]RZM99945.1 hypothetical protein CWO91_34810 [Bradyrhizobium genosp. SA-3]
MQQAVLSLTRPTSAIEALFAKYLTAEAEKRRVYALYNEAEAAGGDDEIEQAHAACDAAFDALEDIADKILRARLKIPADLPIKAQVLVGRDHGNGYWARDVQRFCRDVQIAAAAT